MILAHVGGVPLEEVLSAIGGGATALVVARGWALAHLRRRDRPA